MVGDLPTGQHRHGIIRVERWHTEPPTQVDVHYAHHARQMDARHSPPGTTPIYDRLRTLTDLRVRGLVVGQYGEASEDVHGIADAVAEALAGQRWRLMGARTQTEARAYFISTVRRELHRHHLRDRDGAPPASA